MTNLSLENEKWEIQGAGLLDTREVFAQIVAKQINDGALCRSDGQTDWAPLKMRFGIIATDDGSKKYGILKSLGEGAYGNVYLAFDTNQRSPGKTGRLVAIKCPTESLLERYAQQAGRKADPNISPELNQEKARSWAKLKIGQFFSQETSLTARLAMCPNVVKIIDHDVTVPFMALEFCNGGSLTKRMALPYEFSHVSKWGFEISSALNAAHSLEPDRLVHRDLKPDNILVDNDVLKVSDFGTSQLAQDTHSLKSLRGGYTPLYGAPEAFDGKAYPATDIWSLGVIMYELICGKRPFEGGSIIQMAKTIGDMPHPPLNQRPGLNVPEEIYQWVDACLAKDPQDRPKAAECVALFSKITGISDTDYGKLQSQADSQKVASEAQKVQIETQAPTVSQNPLLVGEQLQLAQTQIDGSPEDSRQENQTNVSSVQLNESTVKSSFPIIAIVLLFVIVSMGAFAYFGSPGKSAEQKTSQNQTNKELEARKSKAASNDAALNDEDPKQLDPQRKASLALQNALVAQNDWESASSLWKFEGDRTKKRAASKSFKLGKTFQLQKLPDQASVEFAKCQSLYQNLSKELQRQVSMKLTNAKNAAESEQKKWELLLSKSQGSALKLPGEAGQGELAKSAGQSAEKQKDLYEAVSKYNDAATLYKTAIDLYSPAYSESLKNPVSWRKAKSLLRDRLKWNKTSKDLQTKAITAVARNLLPQYKWVETREYSCNGQSHRIATFMHLKSAMLMNLIPGGTYQMGSNSGNIDEKPVHEVTIPAMLIGRFEATQAEWLRISVKNPSTFKGDNKPVEKVSWNDVKAWLAKCGGKLRLPSESEWEYACRSGTTTEYFWGPSFNGDYCWYKENSGKNTNAVTAHANKCNAFGLVDMSGNVWEWCEDSWKDNYRNGPVDPYPFTGEGSDHVLRGGSWYYIASGSRSAYRGNNDAAFRDDDLGFRAARTLD
ncbi:MAG: bifunctional serine/threonine-protein kinase/formylglycine-generating enzyme family protein [Planctomycetota bacterium]|nr:bifunctional serine/threonine-protein kinase/formylglycine-generating enzyme family protein [Planctomycetota bacterium]